MTRRPNHILAALASTALAGVIASAALANDDVLKMQNDPTTIVQPNLTYNAWNYSPLDQINTENVGDLVVAWTFQIGVNDQMEAPPLVVGDTMYIVSPKPNRVYALDLKNDGAIKWEYRPDASRLEGAMAVACCGKQTRGINYADGKLFFNTLDGQVIALDAETGQPAWISKGAEQVYGETLVSNGIVIGDLYITGSAGGEYGVRGYVTAYNIHDGKQQWRYYSMGPNNEVGIGPRFKPFYADDKVANPALDSWYGDSWKTGGGTVWGYFSYDPDLNLFYYGTGNCGPWNPDYRREWGKVDLDENGGLASYKNNYCASVMARDATTGELIWAYNINPQDQWDIDEPVPLHLVDLTIDGKVRKAAVFASRLGVLYVWDRATGEIINDPWKFTYTNIIDGVNLDTGRPKYDIDMMMFTKAEDRLKYTKTGALTEEDKTKAAEEAALYGESATEGKRGTEVFFCPAVHARNWENSAWSPQTGLLYVSTHNVCRTMRVNEGKYVIPMPAEGYRLNEWTDQTSSRDLNGQPTDIKHALLALDPVSGKEAWRVESTQNFMSPVTATAGGLILTGDNGRGTFMAHDAKTGKVLWEFRAGQGSATAPVTYIGPDGEQYIVFIASSAPSKTAVGANTDPDAANRYTREGATLYVFKQFKPVKTASN